MLIETLAAKVAFSVLSSTAGAVARGSVLGPGAALAPNPVSQRFRIKKPSVVQNSDIEKLASHVGSQLERLLEVEFRGMPEHEKEAAISAAVDSFSMANVDIWDCGLNPDEYSRRVLKAASAVFARAGLSLQAEACYELILRQVAVHVVQFVTTWPTFAAQVEVEQLKQIQRTRDTVEKIYELMGPDLRMMDLEFEERYCALVAEKLDRLEIFGVDLIDRKNSSYNLTAAYITLSIAESDEGSNSSSRRRVAKRGALLEGDGEEEISIESQAAFGIRTETALASFSRILLRGDAGSGKTTLLRWLSVNSARRGLPVELANWNTLVPFILPLRRFANEELPTPPLFLSEVGSHLSGEMPDGWVNRLLRAGRALVLIDGVDELPADQRETARVWLNELISTYPSARYVVTSRPAAAETDWLSDSGFTSLDLLPMSNSDVESFIRHWHVAARKNETDSDEVDRLKRGERELISSVSEERQLRRLASNPLLCALLCTLNRDRHSQLPRDRMELYKAALEMLLLRRDRERRINYPEPSNISDSQKKSLLGSFAHWLIRNGLTDSAESQAVEQVRLSLQSMPTVTSDAGEVYDYLLVRSGCLRRPVEGRVDFVHRTFQEYLAAARIVEIDDLGSLLANAHLDQWHEVVVMAVGHARPTERSRLIAGLLERGEREPNYRNRLHILAAACLETAGEFDPQVYQRVKEAAAELIPPRRISDAKALAAAGEIVIPLIPNKRMGVNEAAATVRMASTLGGDAGLSLVSRFAADERKKVRGELHRAWNSFDPEEYAKRIISRNPFMRQEISIGSPSFISALDHLPELRGLSVWCELGSADELPPLQGIERIHMFAPIKDFSFFSLRRFKSLRVLSVIAENPGDSQELGGLSSMAMLQISFLGSAPEAHDFQLPSLPRLKNLSLTGPACVDLDGLGSNAPKLSHLTIHVGALKNLEELGNLHTLEVLNISNPPSGTYAAKGEKWSLNSVFPILSTGRLRRLYIGNQYGEDLDIRPLLDLENVELTIVTVPEHVIGWDDERLQVDAKRQAHDRGRVELLRATINPSSGREGGAV